MKYSFNLKQIPNSKFEIESFIWSGKSKIFKDGIEVAQSKEKGKPFLIPSENDKIIKAFPKNSLPDFAPTLEIDGVKIQIVEKLQWYQYALGVLPFGLIAGGAIGGAIGALGTVVNFSIFRKEGSAISKYIKVLGIVLVSYSLYFVIVYFIQKAFE
jgi:hypothetical protein